MTLVGIALVFFPFCISLVNYVCNESFFFAIKSLLVAKLHIIIVHMRQKLKWVWPVLWHLINKTFNTTGVGFFKICFYSLLF